MRGETPTSAATASTETLSKPSASDRRSTATASACRVAAFFVSRSPEVMPSIMTELAQSRNFSAVRTFG
ncbi:MAG: hypothetical protein NTW76_06530 [Corynebacteriales bacterium]|nr:hypothetical protein [Mycobacteriales bacterium]